MWTPWNPMVPPGLFGGTMRQHGGPERRRASDQTLHMLAMVLDEVDYGLLLLGQSLNVLHINRAAHMELVANHPLRLLDQHLSTRDLRDAQALREALQDAAQKGRRRMLQLGETSHSAQVSVVPLAPGACATAAVLVVLGKPQMVGPLAVQGFARTHGLSPSEEQVLAGLCLGLTPQQVANKHGVKIATIRTQISNLRAKTGAESIRDLVQQVACLPPMMDVLQRRPVNGWAGSPLAQ